jgi:ferredoxin
MFQLKLMGRSCISCGICMDVCGPRAIAMRVYKGMAVEGLSPTYLAGLGVSEAPPQPMTSLPYLAAPDRCDGCGDCVDQCPAIALTLISESSDATVRAAGTFDR